MGSYITFPELLIWLPVLAGLLCFFFRKENTARFIAIFFSIIILVISAASLFYTDAKHISWNAVNYFYPNNIGNTFYVGLDGTGRLLTFLTAFAFPFILISCGRNSIKNPASFYGLMMLSQAGLMGVFCAMDALLFYFFWELALIPVYFLCSRWGGEKRIQATFKFFVYTFAGSLLMLIGIIYVYMHTPERYFEGGSHSAHSFAITYFYKAQLTGTEQNWLFWLFFAAFAVKMPVFPFHTWQPDTYDQAPTPVTMVLSGIMVKMGLFGVIRWLIPVFPLAAEKYSHAVIVLSISGIIYASCIAMVQDNIKKLVAYSSIAHIGLMSASLFAMNQTSVQGVMLQMFNHGINIIGLWIVIDLLEKQTGVKQISKLSGVAHKAPVLTILLVIIALANIALPLTNAFPGEFLMLSGLYTFNMWYAAVAGIGIILAAVYTLNMIQKVFYGDVNAATERVQGHFDSAENDFGSYRLCNIYHRHISATCYRPHKGGGHNLSGQAKLAGGKVFRTIMNAIILSAIWGIVMMFSAVFIKSKSAPKYIAILGIILIFIANALELTQGWLLIGIDVHDMLRTTSFNLGFLAVALGCTLFYFLLSGRDVEKVGPHVGEYFALIFFVLCGVSLCATFNTLLFLFLGIEIMSIPLYILTGSDKRNLKSNEAALKYFLMGSFSTGLMLLGIAFLYGGNPNASFYINNLQIGSVGMNPMIVTGMLMMIVSLSFKVSAAPFHFWTPDVYDGAPAVFTSFMSTIVKVAGFFAFVRLFENSFGTMHPQWQKLIVFITVATLLIGNITAVFQQSVKRMLAYSSIAQAGFMMLALFAMNEKAKEGLVLYSAAYSLATIGLFAVLIKMKDYTIEGFNGLSQKQPVLALTATIFLLSLTGIPLTAGFQSKFYMLMAAVENGNHFWLVIVAVLFAAVSAYYYFRVIQAMYFKDPVVEAVPQAWDVTPVFKMLLVVAAGFIIFTGIYPEWILGWLYY